MTGIVAAPDIFSPEHLPPNLKGRDGQLLELARCVAPSAHGFRPLHAWVHGKTGTGKSTVVKTVVARHAAEHGARYVYVNCFMNRTAYGVLDRILDDLRVLRAETPQTGYKAKRLGEALAGRPLVVVLDEVDRMEPAEREGILHLLAEVPGVGLICVSEDRGAFAALPERIVNRLSPVFVEMQPYGTEGMLDILVERAGAGLVAGSWSQAVLEKIAGMCGGDARLAIQTLRASAHLADSEACGYIEERHVLDGYARSQEIRREYRLRRLSVHHRLIYDVVRELGKANCREVAAEYRRRCAAQNLQPMAKRSFYRYCETLRQMRLIRGEKARAFGSLIDLEAVE
jgi:Cdc6-like AAA superfamily ATPase